MNNQRNWLIGGLVGLVIICLCLAVGAIVAGGALLVTTNRIVSQNDPGPSFPQEITVEVEPERPDVNPGDPDDFSPTLTPMPLSETPQPVGEEAQETLLTLENAVVPVNDPLDLSRRLEGKLDIAETLPAPGPMQVGDQKTFWASNVDTNSNFEVEATLRYATDHLYFWIENGVNYDEQALAELCETFENSIYPTNREFFGSEWSPGIDQDPHLYVLFARGLGMNIAGYFSSADEVPPQAHPYSNGHEMFMMNADVMDLGDPYIYGTMTHEFQHMIHWYRDRNEESWMNEGFSVLSELLNGYDVGGFDYVYVSDPDMQLTFWPSPPDATAHYGASFLFLAYYLDRFGEEATQALVANPDNGMDSIDNAMESLNAVDEQTGQPIRAEDIFADWVVASYLNDPSVGDGRYAYQRYETAPSPGPTEEITDCSADWETRTVHQFGVDYVQIDCSGTYTLDFQGSTEVGVLPVDANSGSYAYWSNKGDESNMTLTREFDFTQVSGPLTLEYSTWYDLEADYDYLYLVASEDGETWQILQTPSGRDKSEDPSGNAYGWGYNGQSGGWIQESVDISQFAGKKVQLRFEYVTDAAVNGEGLLLDDISIPEINDTTDLETDEGGWVGDGFVRIQNRLPQNFRITLIQENGSVTVETIMLDENQRASIPLNLENGRATLVISGVTRFTTQEATYQFRFQR